MNHQTSGCLKIKQNNCLFTETYRNPAHLLIYGSLTVVNLSEHFYYWLEENGSLSERKGRSYILKLTINCLSKLNRCWSTLLWLCFHSRGDRILCWATQPVIEFMPEVRGTLVFTILFISMLVWYFYSPPYILVFKDKKIFNLSSIIFVL